MLPPKTSRSLKYILILSATLSPVTDIEAGTAIDFGPH
jgi:hypothetical protein